jgi:hypothetical protein
MLSERVLDVFEQAFDALHAKQGTGMTALWGLVEESGSVPFYGEYDLQRGLSDYQPGLYRKLISLDLNSEIESLCGTIMLRRWRERIVTEPILPLNVIGKIISTTTLSKDFKRLLMLDPEAGDLIPGTGGLRKLHFVDERRGKGKRGRSEGDLLLVGRRLAVLAVYGFRQG